MFVAAFVSFAAFWLFMTNFSPQTMRRLCGYNVVFDIVLHGTILWMFLGTSTMGLLQAEAAGICFSLYIRGYRYFKGYERIVNGRWVRYAGRLT